MSTTDDLIPVLKRLQMSGVLASLELRMRQAVDDALTHEEFLFCETSRKWRERPRNLTS